MIYIHVQIHKTISILTIQQYVHNMLLLWIRSLQIALVELKHACKPDLSCDSLCGNRRTMILSANRDARKCTARIHIACFSKDVAMMNIVVMSPVISCMVLHG